nr:zinc transporter 8 [Pogona vitticeps]
MHHCHNYTKADENRKQERRQAKRRLYVASVISFIFMIAEIIGGHIAGSLAVMTDAAHVLVDLMSFLISIFSLWLSSKPPSKRLTYGWQRAEILGAFLSVIFIWLVTAVLTYLSILRLLHPDYKIEGTVMLITSGCAVIANIIKQFSPELKIADPICTFVFSIFVLATTLPILRDLLHVLMEGMPRGLSYDEVKGRILIMDKVESVHSLHVWSLTMSQMVLSAHIVTVANADKQNTLNEITELLFDTYSFHTVTLQIESKADQKPDCIFCQDPRD